MNTDFPWADNEIASAATWNAKADASHNHGWECGFTIKSPELLPVDPVRGDIIVKLKPNFTGSTVTLTEIVFTSTTDNYPFTLYRSNGAYDFGTTNDTVMLTETAVVDGTAVYSFATGTFTSATIVDNSVPFFSFGTLECVEISGYMKGTY